MIILRAFILSIFLLQPALAIDPGEALSDPQLETRVLSR